MPELVSEYNCIAIDSTDRAATTIHQRPSSTMVDGVAARRAVAQRRSVRVSAALAVTGRRARMGSLRINDLWSGDEVDCFRCPVSLHENREWNSPRG